MTEPLTHEQIQELLGAYALDAVDGPERDAVELHLRDCPRCQAEVREHREVASLLSHTGATAPEGVWAKIVQELEPAPPAMRVTVTPPSDPSEPEPVAEVISIDRPRRFVRVRTLASVVAAAAVIVAVLGVITTNQSRRLDRMEQSLRDVTLDRLASNAQIRPTVQSTLTSPDAKMSAKAVVTADGHGYLLADDLPAAGKDRTYQLWGRVDGQVLSLGTFSGGAGDEVVQFEVQRQRLKGLDAFMVTDERSPGVAVSEQEALLSGTV